MRYLTFLCLFLCSCTSCDREHTVFYQISNQSDETVIINYQHIADLDTSEVTVTPMIDSLFHVGNSFGVAQDALNGTDLNDLLLLNIQTTEGQEFLRDERDMSEWMTSLVEDDESILMILEVFNEDF